VFFQPPEQLFQIDPIEALLTLVSPRLVEVEQVIQLLGAVE
jgi:hypothetical protein